MLFRRTFATIRMLAFPKGALDIFLKILNGYRDLWSLVRLSFSRAGNALFVVKNVANNYDEVLALFGISSLEEAMELKKKVFRRFLWSMVFALLSFSSLASLYWVEKSVYVFALGLLCLSAFFYFLTNAVISIWQIHLLEGRTYRNLGGWLLGE